MAGARTKLLNLFEANIGKSFSKDTLAKEAAIHDWARVIRALRQEGYDLELLKDGTYRMNSKGKSGGHARQTIDRKTRYRILQRDNSTCQRCGRGIKDDVKLDVDHKIPVDYGGGNDDDNLWTLCEGCNEGKKHWFTDEDAETIRDIMNEKSGSKRIEKYFEAHPGELIETSKLDVISGIRDWERTLRLIREKKGKNITFVRKDPETGRAGYVYRP